MTKETEPNIFKTDSLETFRELVVTGSGGHCAELDEELVRELVKFLFPGGTLK